MMFDRKPDLEKLALERLKERFGDGIGPAESTYDMMSVTVRKDLIPDILGLLADDPDLQFRFLTTLCGMHFPGTEQELGVFYHLHSLVHNVRIRLKSFSATDDPDWPTATGIFPAANWMERETWDFFGIRFAGHPNLKRILNMDDFEGFPLRKDFPLEDQTREDKDDTMFGR